MVQIERILFATDFSDCAARAQEYALAFAERFGAELHALHVIQDPGTTWQIGMQIALPNYAQDLPRRMIEAEEEHASEQLQALARSATALAKPPVTAIRHGRPYEQIMQYADEQQIDLIVMGTHGRGIVLHALLGSVAQNVVRQARCPVLTVRLEASAPQTA